MRNLIITLGLLLIPLSSVARDYNADNLPYKDAPADRSTAVAVSVLTEAGIVEGIPDGTFRPERHLNRAEFMKIVMGFLAKDAGDLYTNCFPDVFATEWYAEPVCRAKALGIVEGNRVEGVDSSKWLFAPVRTVRYAEALKILSIIFGVDTPSTGGEWYEKYLQAAKQIGISLPENPNADQFLTRGEMSRLTVRYLANNEGQLAALIAAEAGEDVIDEVDTSTELSAGEEVEEEEVVEEEPETETGALEEEEEEEIDTTVYDELYDASQATVTDNFILLGEISPILGSASVFSETQPLEVEALIVRFNTAPTSIESFMIYDHDTKYLGNAYMDPSVSGGIQFKLSLKAADLVIPKMEDYSFYVRAVAKDSTEGGVSGDIVQIARLGVQGVGAWNNKTQTENALGPFPVHQTARAMITEISNGGQENGVLISGNHMRIGSFQFKARESTGSGSAEVELTDLSINVNQGNGITLTNVRLSANDTSAEMTCSIASNIITCSSMDSAFGVVPEGILPRVLTLYADIAIASDVISSNLQLSINDPGGAMSAGSVRWTDGEANLHWVDGDAPVARSTIYDF